MTNNHLFIGLGGTGGKVLQSFRRLVYRQHKNDQPGNNVKLGYLYIDSDDHLMKTDNASWMEQGVNVHLAPDDMLLINGNSIRNIINDINQFPAVKEFTNPLHLLQKLGATDASGKILGGQKRRLGRLLIALKAKELKAKLQNSVSKLQDSSKSTNVTFHVCAGLAGGTGSGIIIDVISQIRKDYKYDESSHNYQILLYLFIPEDNPGSKDFGNYHANGYAALKELNALHVKKLQPIDINGDVDYNTGRVPVLNVIVPFNAAYIYHDINQNGQHLNTTEDLPNVIANFLYQKTVIANTVSWEALKRFENAENADNDHEDNLRSLRFMGLGINRVIYPKTEIQEYITLNLAHQLILQMRFNNWAETGFVDKGSYIINHDNIKNEIISKYPISEDFLTLNQVPYSRTNSFWETVNTTSHQYLQDIQHRNPEEKKKHSDLLKEKIQKDFFSKRFRDDVSGGVQDYFNYKRAESPELVNTILYDIEKYVFARWIQKELSLIDCIQIFKNLKEYFIYLADKFRKGISQLKEHYKDAGAEWQKADTEYKKSSILGWFYDSGSLENVRDKLAKYYCKAIEGNSMQYAIEHCSNFTKATADLISKIETLNARMAEAQKGVENAIHNLLNDSDSFEYKKHTKRYYNKAKIIEGIQAIKSNKSEMDLYTHDMMDRFQNVITEDPTFREIERKKIKIQEVVENKAREIVGQESQKNPQLEALLNIKIMGLLHDDIGQQNTFTSFAKERLEAAGIYYVRNNDEYGKSGKGVEQSKIQENKTIFFPNNNNEHFEFINKLKQSFKENGIKDSDFNDYINNEHELCIVSLENLVPLRCIKPVEKLKMKYQQLLNGLQAEEKNYVLHIQNHDKSLPDLFLPNTLELQESINELKKELQLHVEQARLNASVYLILCSCPLLKLTEDNESGETSKEIPTLLLQIDDFEFMDIKIDKPIHKLIQELIPDVEYDEKYLDYKVSSWDDLETIKSEKEKEIESQKAIIQLLKNKIEPLKRERLKDTQLRSDIKSYLQDITRKAVGTEYADFYKEISKAAFEYINN